MLTSDYFRKNLVVIATTVGISLLLIVVIILVLVSPPAPEAVVNDLVIFIRSGDDSKLEQVAEGPALTGLLQAQDSEQGVVWQTLWRQGDELYQEFRIGEVVIEGDSARVVVFYGTGLFQEQEFYLRRQNKKWKVYDIR